MRPAELGLAKQLVAGLVGELSEATFTDQHRASVVKLIEARANGEPDIEFTPQAEPEATGVDLMAVLQAFRRAGHRASGRLIRWASLRCSPTPPRSCLTGPGSRFEPKYDGMRVIALGTATGVRLLSRDGNDKARQLLRGLDLADALRRLHLLGRAANPLRLGAPRSVACPPYLRPGSEPLRPHYSGSKPSRRGFSPGITRSKCFEKEQI